MPRTHPRRQWWPIAMSILVVLLAAAVITLGSFRVPLEPGQRNAYTLLFALSTIIGVSLLIFASILMRYLVKLGLERRSGQLGSRFKVKMVLGAMGVSLLPVVFLFIFSYALINRTLNLWFPRPLEIANEQSQTLLSHFEAADYAHLTRLAAAAVVEGSPDAGFLARTHSADIWWVANAIGKVVASGGATPGGTSPPISPEPVQTIRGGAQVWKVSGQLYLAGTASVIGGTLYVARRLPDDFPSRYADIETQTSTYL